MSNTKKLAALAVTVLIILLTGCTSGNPPQKATPESSSEKDMRLTKRSLYLYTCEDAVKYSSETVSPMLRKETKSLTTNELEEIRTNLKAIHSEINQRKVPEYEALASHLDILLTTDEFLIDKLSGKNPYLDESQLNKHNEELKTIESLLTSAKLSAIKDMTQTN
ncbi:hypothetical protein GJ688_15045 [Heliobacillus mobilis]|uniref:Lipoprotein n=1 Tax=Heliobacterium mobile TaxID=28064 RepID=A0A6I3SNK8_HELMO|nr:hypothetical protein [Heliobacterium mobile]MTV50285.1 hypothetical protein [Heliobacterium mobile]